MRAAFFGSVKDGPQEICLRPGFYRITVWRSRQTYRWEYRHRKMFHGGHNGVGSGLDQVTDLLLLVQVLQSAVVLSDPGEDLQHTACADTAEGVLSCP